MTELICTECGYPMDNTDKRYIDIYAHCPYCFNSEFKEVLPK